jgi:small subunit ribosomal protein S20
MANTKSAKKAIRSAAKKKARNDIIREKVRKSRLALLKGIDAKEKPKKLDELLSNFYKQLDKATKTGAKVFSKNKAARLKSQMARKVALA